jgi:transcriptional regulator with XRE-family HTH domain
MREAARKTQEEAAEIVHVNVRTWQRFESGEKEIPEGIIHLFCLMTQIDYDTYRREYEEARRSGKGTRRT